VFDMISCERWYESTSPGEILTSPPDPLRFKYLGLAGARHEHRESIPQAANELLAGIGRHVETSLYAGGIVTLASNGQEDLLPTVRTILQSLEIERPLVAVAHDPQIERGVRVGLLLAYGRRPALGAALIGARRSEEAPW
jgi:hypothetical protein